MICPSAQLIVSVPSAIGAWAVFAAVAVSMVVTSVVGGRTGNMQTGANSVMTREG
jgi:hypothetical protein